VRANQQRNPHQPQSQSNPSQVAGCLRRVSTTSPRRRRTTTPQASSSSSAPRASNSSSTRRPPWSPTPSATCSHRQVGYPSSPLPFHQRAVLASHRITSIPLVILTRRLLRDAPGRGPLPGDPHPHPREDLPVFLLVAPLLQVPMLTFHFRQSSSLFPFQAFNR